MKYIVFNNKKVDTQLVLQLQDMACVLTGISDLKFKFDYGHYLDPLNNTISASHFWDTLQKREMEAGYKTDLYLRAIGTLHYTDEKNIKYYVASLEEVPIKKFATQLFTLLEDLRLEEICKRERPGTSRLFKIRKLEYHKYFTSQLQVNTNRGYSLDALFCMIYLTLQTDTPDPIFVHANQKENRQLDEIKSLLYQAYEAKHSGDIVRIAEQIIYKVSLAYEKDSMNEYFILPLFFLNSEEGLTLEDLKRKNKLKTQDKDEVKHEQDEAKDEKLPTWHGETKDQEQKRSFLQFDLENGTQTTMLGNSARPTEDGDDALGSVQGKSKPSQKKNYPQTEVEKSQSSDTPTGSSQMYGEENKHAVPIMIGTNPPSEDDKAHYQVYLVEVEHHINKLAKTIEKTMEHKRNNPKTQLSFGRLSKNLIPLILDEFPKVFYKKNQVSKEIDAVFTLLVDCSASMFNKMEETKKGIILFHEVLKKLAIPHSIVGFWEDANQVKEGYQPNYFHVISDFRESLYSKSGAQILQLQPQEDNRDGFSIRVVTSELQKRKEKNKFLLVFSDGEPAASQYDQNGIIDTKEAVMQARKKRIEVIGMFLSNGQISEEEEITMQNIYDREHLLIPSVQELPEKFTPLLKKLLLKSI